MRKTDQEQRRKPFHRPRYRSLKEALKYAAYSRPGGKSAGHVAGEIGVTLVDLSRWLSDNPDDPRGKLLDVFIPLLIALEDAGMEVWEYIGEEIRAAQEGAREDAEAAANRFFADHGPALAEALKVIAARGKKN